MPDSDLCGTERFRSGVRCDCEFNCGKIAWVLQCWLAWRYLLPRLRTVLQLTPPWVTCSLCWRHKGRNRSRFEDNRSPSSLLTTLRPRWLCLWSCYYRHSPKSDYCIICDSGGRSLDIKVERWIESTPGVWTRMDPVDPYFATGADDIVWQRYRQFAEPQSYTDFVTNFGQGACNNTHVNAVGLTPPFLGHSNCLWHFGYECLSVSAMRFHVIRAFPIVPHPP